MAEGEQRRDPDAVVVPVADVQTLAVDDLEILARPVVVRGRVLESSRECALKVKN